MTPTWVDVGAGLKPAPTDGQTTIPRIVFAGTASGVGKTTVAMATMAALSARGLAVAPFKVGPDYIDPSFHGLAAGRTCRNLDSWLVPHSNLLCLFARACCGMDVAVVEGVMGLYDGRSGAGESGSTAEVAKLLGAPVLLVLDIGKQARSAAASARGFQAYDPSVPLAGFVLNRAGSQRHADLVAREVESATGLPVLGALPKDTAVELPERHLGLVPTQELERAREVLERLAELAREHLDLDRLVAIARDAAAPPQLGRSIFPAEPLNSDPLPLAVARDEAFSFYYEDNLDLLTAFGAEVLPFSPLSDAALPRGARGMYLGGGFPELFAARLAANTPLLSEVRRAVGDGLPIYAECGGLMYLAEALTDFDGDRHQMAGLIPCEVAMANRRMALGYVELRAQRDTLLCPAGTELRGHEFHWSRLFRGADQANAYDVVDPTPRAEGFANGNLLASYVHLHFGSETNLACRFVEAMR
jgi:cobyrinic acid a,c-diamide synthase